MKKKLLVLCSALFLILSFCAFTYRSGSYVYDGTGNITNTEALNSRISSMRETIGSDVVIVMTDQPTTSSYMQAAKDEVLKFVNTTGGYGDYGAAILLYVDMANRRFAIVEHSTGKYLLSDGEIDAMTDSSSMLTQRLSAGNYDGACETFLSYVEEYAKPGFFQTVFGWITAALGIGGAATKYGEWEETNHRTGGERILPLTMEEAKGWAERELSADAYEEEFGPVGEDGSRVMMTISVSAAEADRIDSASAAYAEFLKKSISRSAERVVPYNLTPVFFSYSSIFISIFFRE